MKYSAAGVPVVGAQMDVVVGQHEAAGLSASIASATGRSVAVVTFMFSRGASTTATDATGRLHQRRVVRGGRQGGVVHVEGAAQDVGAEDLRRLHRPERGAVERAHDAAARVGLLDGVGDRAAAIAPSAALAKRGDAALDEVDA